MPLTYSSFNGRIIVPLPTSVQPSQIELAMHDSVAVTQSPWTMQSQTQYYPGADFWTLSVSLPPMTQAQGQVWQGWFGSMRGKLGTFQLGDPAHHLPLGSPSGSPVLVVDQLVGTTTINTSGWTPSTSNLLAVGDQIQIGYRLHTVCGSSAGGQVNSDSSGNAQIEIWPSLRDAYTSAPEAIITSGTTGLWMLDSNERGWMVSAQDLLVTISFKAVEAR